MDEMNAGVHAHLIPCRVDMATDDQRMDGWERGSIKSPSCQPPTSPSSATVFFAVVAAFVALFLLLVHSISTSTTDDCIGPHLVTNQPPTTDWTGQALPLEKDEERGQRVVATRTSPQTVKRWHPWNDAHNGSVRIHVSARQTDRRVGSKRALRPLLYFFPEG